MNEENKEIRFSIKNLWIAFGAKFFLLYNCRMIQRAEPHDFIALVLIVGGFVLALRGESVIAPMIISGITGFYFGAKSNFNR